MQTQEIQLPFYKLRQSVCLRSVHYQQFHVFDERIVWMVKLWQMAIQTKQMIVCTATKNHLWVKGFRMLDPACDWNEQVF